MAKTLKQKLFGKKPVSEVMLGLVSLSAGTITIFQNINLSSSLSAGIESNITKTPTNLWMLGLGVLLLITTILLMKKK